MTSVLPSTGVPVDSVHTQAPSPAPAAFADVLAAKTVTLGEMIALQARQAGAAPPAASPVQDSAAAPQATGTGERVIAAGSRYLGVPYRWGGTDPASGLDCSGFVQRTFADLGVSLPRTSSQQALEGTSVAGLADARPGDLVYWRGSPNHIGIYAGDGQMLVAPRSGDVVKFQSLASRRPPDAIRRIV